jgi:hypothetical protein
MVKAIYSWKPISRRPIGRPKTRWVDDVRKDIQKLKVPNWKTLAQDRERWRTLVEKAKLYKRVVESHKKERSLHGVMAQRFRICGPHIFTLP